MKYRQMARTRQECDEFAEIQQLSDAEKARRLQKWDKEAYRSEYDAGYADGYLPGFLSGARHQLKRVVRILLSKYSELTCNAEDEIKWAEEEQLVKWFNDLKEGRVPAKLRGSGKRKEDENDIQTSDEHTGRTC